MTRDRRGARALLVRRLALAGASTALALAVGSWWLRAEGAFGTPVEPFDPYVEDDVMGFVLKPSWTARHVTPAFDVTVRTNAEGMRDDPVSRAKPADVYRIVLLGDSFAYGWGVERAEGLASVLERRLRRPGRRVEVVNLAVPGQTLVHHLLELRRRGLDFEPDLVLLQLCTNDLYELMWLDLTLDDDRLPVAVRRRPVATRGQLDRVLELARKHGFPRHELDASLLVQRPGEPPFAAELRALLLADVRAAEAPEEAPEDLSADELERGLRNPAFQVRYARHLLAAIARDCASRDVPLRVVVASLNRAGASVGPLREVCAGLAPASLFDIDVLDSPERTWLHGDRHWSAEGHWRMGEAVASWLEADPALDG